MYARRIVACTIVFSALVHSTGAQIPSPSVNMVSGTTWPAGDPFLQRQNEPSIAASTRNPLHLLAGANDYRTVDIPGLEEGRVTGDAWLGVFKSFDGGQTWRSTLLAGYPQDTSTAGTASPIHGYAAGADPTVRAGTNGLFFYSGIAFDRTVSTTSRANRTRKPGARGTAYTAADPFGASAVFVARFIDNNNRPNGDPIDYINTGLIKSNPGTFFLDKPWLAVDIPRFGAATCSIPATPNAPAQAFPAGRLYVAFAEVEGTGAATQSRIMFARSLDCGATWSTPQEISIGHRINQGATIAVDHITGAVYVAWRRFASDGQPAAIHIVKSVDGGVRFTTPVKVANITPFDQGTSSISMRSSAFPTMIIGTLGRVYVAWAQRQVGPGGDARIVITNSNGGVTSGAPDDDDLGTAPNHAMSWSAPAPVNNTAERGHQIMPSLSFAAGRLNVIFYNLVQDHTRGVFTRDPATGAMVETREAAGDLPGSPEKVFSPFVAEAVFTGTDAAGVPQFTGGLSRRHTLDVWVAQATQGPAPVFTARRLSNYRAGSRPGSTLVEQLQFNPPLLPLFACGTSGNPADCRPFIGDYIDLAPSPAFRTDPFGIWIPNALPLDTAVFHAVWTDNRDVRPPADGNWANYTPPVSAFSQTLGPKSLFDPNVNRPTCQPSGEGLSTAGMRNQNIYTARVTRGLYVSATDNSKQLGSIQRAFAVSVQNTTDVAKTYRLRLRFGARVVASFLQFTSLTTLDVTVAPRSTISRSVFVQSPDRRGRVTVDVTEVGAPGGSTVPGGLNGDLVLNPDITNPDITNPDITNAEVYNPDITNPDITNPDITNPDITNPDITNPDITNPDITNPDITNPDITNPDITNPDITNPDITNPDITNPDITNGSLTDTTWTVENSGTVSAAYTVKLLLNGQIPAGIKLQLILHRIYKTPMVVDCEIGEQSHNVLVANIRNPAFVTNAAELANPDITNPDITNATLALGPGETARITLRVVDPDRADGVTFSAVASVSPVVVAQAVNTLDAAAGIREPTFTTPPLRVLLEKLPDGVADGVAGTVYPGAVLTASGGIGARTWALAPDSGPLPPGLTLSPDGSLSGTPTTPGTYSFSARVTDSADPPQTATGPFTIRVATPLVFAAPAPPSGTVGTGYTYALGVTGGTVPYTFAVIGGALPPGLTMTSAGVIQGVPTAAGTFTSTVRVTDAAAPAQTASRTVQIEVLQRSSTTTLSSNAPLAILGAPVTLTASVWPIPPVVEEPMVEFRDGEVVLGTASVNTDGFATFTLFETPFAAQVLTARFIGTPSVPPSTSNVVNQHYVRRFVSEGVFSEAANGDVTRENFNQYAAGTPLSQINPVGQRINVGSSFGTLEIFDGGVVFGYDGVTRQPGGASGRYDLLFVQPGRALAFDITAQDPNTSPATIEVLTSAGSALFSATNTGAETSGVFHGFLATLPLQGVRIYEGCEVNQVVGPECGNEEISVDNFIMVMPLQ